MDLQALKQRVRNEEQRIHTAQAVSDRKTVIEQISKYLSMNYTFSGLEEFLRKARHGEPLPTNPIDYVEVNDER